MPDARTPSRNRRYGEKHMGRKFLLFVGDCSQTGEVIANKPVTPLWVIVGFLDTLLRSYGQVVYCNNPVTGLLVMCALFVSGPFTAVVGLAATTAAIFTAWLLDQPVEALRGGVFSYNALLVGQMMPILLPEMTVIDWIFTIVGSIFSVYFTSSFAALFGSISKHPMPPLTVPFVLAQILVYLCATSPGVQYWKTSVPESVNSSFQLFNGLEPVNISEVDVGNTNTSSSQDLVVIAAATLSMPLVLDETLPSYTLISNSSSSANNVSLDLPTNLSIDNIDSLDWGEVLAGMLKSPGQAYGQEHLAGSLLMYLGIIISSPTTALMCLIGSAISTLVGALLNPSTAYEGLYEGVWGFNGLLSAGALGGFALVLTPQSAALAMVGALLAAGFQFALLSSFARAGVPLLTLPFNLATLLLLCATARGGGSLVRPPALTFPEKHLRDWRAERAASRSRKVRSASQSFQDEAEETKERFRKLEMV